MYFNNKKNKNNNKNIEINTKNMGLNIDKNEYSEIVLSNSNSPEKTLLSKYNKNKN